MPECSQRFEAPQDLKTSKFKETFDPDLHSGFSSSAWYMWADSFVCAESHRLQPDGMGQAALSANADSFMGLGPLWPICNLN